MNRDLCLCLTLSVRGNKRSQMETLATRKRDGDFEARVPSRRLTLKKQGFSSCGNLAPWPAKSCVNWFHGVHDRLWLFLATLGYLASAGWGLVCARLATDAGEPVDAFLIAARRLLAHTVFLQRARGGDRPLPDHESVRDAGVFLVVAGADLSRGRAGLPDVDPWGVHRAGGFPDQLSSRWRRRSMRPATCRTSAGSSSCTRRMALLGFGVLGVAALAGVAYLIQERQLEAARAHLVVLLAAQRGAAGDGAAACPLLGIRDFSVGAALGFFIPHHGPDDWVKIAWSGVVWVLYAGLVLVLALGRLSHKKTALLSVARLCFYPADVLGHQFPERGACFSARRAKGL
jgi:hypothetical protein